MKEKLDENLIKSLRTIARGIAGPTVDPDDLVSGALEYLISNEKKYMDHPNIKAILILKMKGLNIDEIRKNKKMTSITDNEGNDLQFVDKKQIDIPEKINLTNVCKKTLSVIKTMDEKCREIIMLAADDLSYKDIAESIQTPIGTVMSRLLNCRKKLKGLMSS